MKFVAFAFSMSEKVTIIALWSSLLPKIGVAGSFTVGFVSKCKFTKPVEISLWLSYISLVLLLSDQGKGTTQCWQEVHQRNLSPSVCESVIQAHYKHIKIFYLVMKVELLDASIGAPSACAHRPKIVKFFQNYLQFSKLLIYCNLILLCPQKLQLQLKTYQHASLFESFFHIVLYFIRHIQVEYTDENIFKDGIQEPRHHNVVVYGPRINEIFVFVFMLENRHIDESQFIL